jgi:hypothetical protein
MPQKQPPASSAFSSFRLIARTLLPCLRRTRTGTARVPGGPSPPPSWRRGTDLHKPEGPVEIPGPAPSGRGKPIITPAVRSDRPEDSHNDRAMFNQHRPENLLSLPKKGLNVLAMSAEKR